MKNFILCLSIFISSNIAMGNGISIVNVSEGKILRLLNTSISVSIENQAAVVTTTQTFRNDFSATQKVLFGFPMPETATGTDLFYKINSVWYHANFSSNPQDTSHSGPGGTQAQYLTDYLGKTPLYFPIPGELGPDSLLTIQLVYVELLEYKFGSVQFSYPQNYLSIKNDPLDELKFNLNLRSGKAIQSLTCPSHSNAVSGYNGGTGNVTFVDYQCTPQTNFVVNYQLNSEELGIFSLSTFFKTESIPDQGFPGFFTTLVEPDPGTQISTIPKYFTLIIDHSGSMYGTKMEQAKAAAAFIMNNLNSQDYFNIIQFASGQIQLSNSHIPYTTQNKETALNFVKSIEAWDGTNISGAFSLAIPQFSTAPDTVASIIIFFTDGEATEGLTNTIELSDSIKTLNSLVGNKINIFTFGIGESVNTELLSLIASRNNGLFDLLSVSEVETKISEFYLKIKNPVLLNPSISIPSENISEIYPLKLPSIYKGQQLILSGRYKIPGSQPLTLTGTAFGRTVSYPVQLDLVDSSIQKHEFLSKIWAKKKIESLLVAYYLAGENTPEANAVKEKIIAVSLQFKVLSIFTSFSGGDTGGPATIDDKSNRSTIPLAFILDGNYPNPFNPGTKISIRILENTTSPFIISIYDILGRLIKTVTLFQTQSGELTWYWDGTDEMGKPVPTGTYIYTVSSGSVVLAGKMTLVK